MIDPAPHRLPAKSGPAGDVVIDVQGLSKVYRLYGRPADFLRELVTGRQRHSEFWALRDISFAVRRGEVVGVVGRNGAGKSTLLRILAGTLDATGGRVATRGKVAAILELGSGFHPDYTGRENVYMGGLCLGMSRAEIDRKFDEIVEFSELGDAMDRPFRTYSTGMQARLTFSTAISVEADILIVDEALSVGDALFSEKCFRRIRSLADSGATIFFVTHSLGHVNSLCSRAILLHEGRLITDDTPREIAYEYEAILGRDRSRSLGQQQNSTAMTREGDSPPDANVRAFIQELSFVDPTGSRIATLSHGEICRILSRVKFNEDVTDAAISFRLDTPAGVPVAGESTSRINLPVHGRRGEEVEVSFEFENRLGPGEYLLGGGVAEILNGTYNVLHLYRGRASVTITSARPVTGVVDMRCAVTVTGSRGRS